MAELDEQLKNAKIQKLRNGCSHLRMQAGKQDMQYFCRV